MPEGFDPHVELAKIRELEAIIRANRKGQKLAQSSPNNPLDDKQHASHDDYATIKISSQQTA